MATHGRDLRFLVFFFLLIGVYYWATTTAPLQDHFFPWYLRGNAAISVSFFNAIGYDDVHLVDQTMKSDDFHMEIARGCDGLDPSALFVAAVLASPVAFRRKIPALLIGTGLLLVLNVVRIITLWFTGIYFQSFFELMHLDVWQAAFIVMALLFWMIWATRLARKREPKAHAAT